MTLLMGISPTSFFEAGTVVALAKLGKDIGNDCRGDETYAWFSDVGGKKSALAGRGRVVSISETVAPQKRDPSKTTKALSIVIDQYVKVVRELSTNDVEAFRDDFQESPMKDIGRMHKDRNEKVIKISDCTRDILSCRFEKKEMPTWPYS